MKYLTLNIKGNKIEIFNSFFGKETIKVNDEVVSSKFSVFGYEHNFLIFDNEKELKCRLNIGMSFGVVYDLYIDNKPIMISSKNGLIRFFYIMIVFIVYKLLVTYFS